MFDKFHRFRELFFTQARIYRSITCIKSPRVFYELHRLSYMSFPRTRGSLSPLHITGGFGYKFQLFLGKCSNGNYISLLTLYNIVRQVWRKCHLLSLKDHKIALKRIRHFKMHSTVFSWIIPFLRNPLTTSYKVIGNCYF